MAETMTRRVLRPYAASEQDAAAHGRGRRGYWARVRVRLWVLLNAPALTGGSAHGLDPVAAVEDDRRRLSAGRML